MPRKKTNHPALQAITRKQNPLIYNPHNPNHTQGSRGGRKYLFDPYARVFNTDESVKEATAPVTVPLIRPVSRRSVFNMDQGNSPLYNAEAPTRAPSPVDMNPMDIFSRQIPVQSLPGTPVQQVSNDLVGHAGAGARAPSQRNEIARVAGAMPDPNPFGNEVGHDIPMLNAPQREWVMLPPNPVHGVRRSDVEMHVPPVIGKRSRSDVDIGISDMSTRANVKNVNGKRRRIDVATTASVLGKRTAQVNAQNKRRKVVDSEVKNTRKKVVDSMVKNTRKRVVHDIETKKLREKVVKSMADNTKAKVKHDLETKALRKRALSSMGPKEVNIGGRAKRRRLK